MLISPKYGKLYLGQESAMGNFRTLMRRGSFMTVLRMPMCF